MMVLPAGSFNAKGRVAEPGKLDSVEIHKAFGT